MSHVVHATNHSIRQPYFLHHGCFYSASHAHNVAHPLQKRYFCFGFEARPLRLHVNAAVHRDRGVALARCIEENRSKTWVELGHDMSAFVCMHADAAPGREIIRGH